MTDKDNPFFTRNLANRAWAHFLGRGLVEPIDDVRDTNPPTNPELLDALAKHLVESKFDFKQLIRTITASRTYQLSSRPNATNERDEQNYSRALFKRPAAEVLLDMVCDATGVPEKFSGVPAGARHPALGQPRTARLPEAVRPSGADDGVRVRTRRRTDRGRRCCTCSTRRRCSALSHDGGRLAKLERDFCDDGRLAEELY
jgi:hypothetical protein